MATMMTELKTSRVVDTAEPWEIAEKLLLTGWERQQLYSGDFAMKTYVEEDLLGVTRKTVDDLLSSIFLSDNKAKGQGKHPFKMQLEEMLEYYKYRKILVEGSWAKIMGDDLTRHAVQNFLARWQDKGFGLEITSGPKMTVRRLNELYALYQKPYSMVGNTKGFADDRVLAFPSGCRGRTGQKVLNCLGSLKAVSNAEMKDLIEVDDVGSKRAWSIYWHFNRGEVKE